MFGDCDGSGGNQMAGEQSVGAGVNIGNDRGEGEGEGELGNVNPGELRAELNYGEHVILI